MPTFVFPRVVSPRAKLQRTLVYCVVLVTSFFSLVDVSATIAAEDAVKPVAHWRFGTEETAKLTPHGGVHRDQPGPRPPEFPDFDSGNTAVKLDGKGARFVLADPGPSSDFDFIQGDAITIQAWVNMDQSIDHDSNLYVIGKGRTHSGKVSGDNQNWALRLRGVDGQAKVSFLFASEPEADPPKRDSHWHRWTSDVGFVPGTGWHRIAISYRFGEPKSIAAWLNEKKADGKWDMGGATDKAPIVDDDAIWIGSSMGGSAGNSFVGLVDDIAIYREVLSDAQMRSLYHREGPQRNVTEFPEVRPLLTNTPGAVSVRIFEGIGPHDRWMPLDTAKNPPIVDYDADEMLFPRLPKRYDEYGVRASWKGPALLQAAAQVELPAGEHQMLVRSRGVSRVWLGEEVIVRIGVRKGGGDAHQPVLPLPDPPLPGHRLVGFGDQETVVSFRVETAGVYPLVFESIVGSSKIRVEPGETLLAICIGGDDAFKLVRDHAAGSPAITVTDDAVEYARGRIESRLDSLETQIRRRAAGVQDDYWAGRHEAARRWVAANPAPPIPSSPSLVSRNPIDAFLAAKIDVAKADATQSHGDAAQFQKDVLPILREHCFRCHDENAEGGLQLTSRDAVLAGGDSGDPAVVPNDIEESLLIARIRSTDEGERMPPSGNLRSDQIQTLEQWIAGGVSWGHVLAPESITPSEIVDDAAFLRRVYLDCWGVPPTDVQAREFLNSADPNKRRQLIDRLLDDQRVADHWVSYWQDVLAENPNILKPSINNTGPFRFFLHEALRDHWSIDRLVTELVMLRGSEREGGAAGFGMAADNDAPLATRGLVLASAFLGIDLQCARCHDSPYHGTTQQDLFALSAMLARKPVTVPKTSSVSPGFFDSHKGRQSLIKVTLQPGVPVEPQWPFASTTRAEDNESIESLMRSPGDSRERLAVLITAPSNERFASVMVNRIWKRLIGAGLVEPASDWEAKKASHPELLTWLAREFVASGFDDRHLIRLILNSDVYQREAKGSNLTAIAADRFFAAPDRRRLTAEQIVDSLFYSSGHPMKVDEITFDADGIHAPTTMISLGVPKRSWEFATLSNERDRPSLALPRAQAVTDVLEAFGWNGSRQNAITDRDADPNVLQPGILANGVMASWITRASIDSELANLAVKAGSVDELVETLFLRFLSRQPSDKERGHYRQTLSAGFDNRLLPSEEVVRPAPFEPLSHVSWRNHLRSEANLIKIEMERRARVGDPADPRLRTPWREAYEDVVWSLINSPEYVWVP